MRVRLVGRDRSTALTKRDGGDDDAQFAAHEGVLHGAPLGRGETGVIRLGVPAQPALPCKQGRLSASKART